MRKITAFCPKVGIHFHTGIFHYNSSEQSVLAGLKDWQDARKLAIIKGVAIAMIMAEVLFLVWYLW